MVSVDLLVAGFTVAYCVTLWYQLSMYSGSFSPLCARRSANFIGSGLSTNAERV